MLRITDLCAFMIITHLILLKIRNVSNDVVDKIKTGNLHSIRISENRVANETMWKNVIQPNMLCMLDK